MFYPRGRDVTPDHSCCVSPEEQEVTLWDTSCESQGIPSTLLTLMGQASGQPGNGETFM